MLHHNPSTNERVNRAAQRLQKISYRRTSCGGRAVVGAGGWSGGEWALFAWSVERHQTSLSIVAYYCVPLQWGHLPHQDTLGEEE